MNTRGGHSHAGMQTVPDIRHCARRQRQSTGQRCTQQLLPRSRSHECVCRQGHCSRAWAAAGEWRWRRPARGDGGSQLAGNCTGIRRRQARCHPSRDLVASCGASTVPVAVTGSCRMARNKWSQIGLEAPTCASSCGSASDACGACACSWPACACGARCLPTFPVAAARGRPGAAPTAQPLALPPAATRPLPLHPGSGSLAAPGPLLLLLLPSRAGLQGGQGCAVSS